MQPVERKILGELRRRSTWEKWGEHFERRLFISEDARRVRDALEELHGSDRKPILPLAWINSSLDDGVSVRLENPIPESAADKKLRKILLRLGLQEHLTSLKKTLESGDDGDREAESWGEFLGSLPNSNGRTYSEALEAPLAFSDLLKHTKKNRPERIPTYIHSKLDEHLGGGISLGELCVLQSPFGEGKTTILLHVAYRRALEKKRVLYLSCENYLEQLGERLEQIKKTLKKPPPKSLLVQYVDGLNFKHIQSYVSAHGPLDTLVVDYFGNMEGADVLDPHATHLLLKQLRSFAKRERLVIWTATQEHEPERWQFESERGRMYGSKKVGHLCDLLLGLHSTPSANTMKFTLHKRRGMGRRGKTFRSYFNPDTAELREK